MNMKLKASIPVKGYELIITVEEDNDNGHSDHFGELEHVKSAQIKETLRTVSDEGFYIDSEMDIYVTVGAPHDQNDLHLYYGCYLDHLVKLRNLSHTFEKCHAIIKEQVEDYIIYNSKILNGDIGYYFISVDKQQTALQTINGYFFAHSEEVEHVDSIGSVEIDLGDFDDFSNVTSWVKEFCPELTEKQLEEIKTELCTDKYK